MADLYLDGVQAKLERAASHLEALQDEIRAFFARDPYMVRSDLDCEAGKYRLYFEIREQPPLMWSVILGDLVHNLRSALDHLAWQLVIFSGNKPGRGTQFPIFTSEPTTEKACARWKGMVAGMSDPILDTIRHVQPYTTPHGTETGLAILNLLSNRDKHRLPVPRVAAVARHQEGSIGLVPTESVAITNPQILIGRPLEHGDEIASADIECHGPDPQVNFKGPIPMDIAFSAGSNHVPMQGLIEILQHAQVVVGIFESRCAELASLPESPT